MSDTSIPARQARDVAKDAAGLLLGAIKHAFEIIVRSIDPTSEHAWLTDAQLRLYRTSTRHNALMLAIGGFLVAQACADWVPWPARTTWWVTVAAVVVAAELVSRYFDRIDNATLETVRLRAWWCVGATAIFVFAWSSMTVFLWAPGSELNHMFLILILACSLAGSSAISAIHPATALTIFVVCGAFLVAPLALSNLALDRVLAYLSTIYILLMAGQLVAIGSTSRKMLTLDHERATLVGNLRDAKIESDRDRARAVEAARTKSQFLSNMNHELRTPMNAILGFSELIRHKSFGADVDKYAEYAEIINHSGRHLLALIDDMLDLARIEGGRLSLRESSVDLKAIVVAALEENAAAAEQAKLSLIKSVGRGIPRVRADERAMRQIVSNLLSNALKFTPAGGCVTAFLRIEPDGRPAMGVEDTGIGIAREDQATVFERFGKGRHDVTTMDKGTGLGLAIVKGFAEAHDGEVKLESGIGSGTRVTVFLPASRMERAELQPQGG